MSFRPPKIVLANGVFDIFHYGHLLYLQEAAKMGDCLIVGVTRNIHVNKGPNRPMFDELNRAAIVGALKCVYETVLCDDSLDALESVKPHIFVKGADYIGKIQQKHLDYCEAHDIEIRFTHTDIYSATKIINDRLGKS